MASIGTFNIDGLASGLDTKSIISKLLSIDRLPLTRMRQEKANYTAKIPLLQQVNSLLLTLKNLSADLKTQSFFTGRKAVASDATKVTVSAAADAPLGTHTLDSITRLATATKATSTGTIGGPANAGALFPANGMRTEVTAGTFTINGATFAVDTATDSLSDVIGKINLQTATTGVTASYDAVKDKLVLRKSDNTTIVLGGSNDTSNFLTATGVLGAYQDASSGRTTVESTVHLGALDKTETLASANLAEAVTSGNFRINGVTITVDSASDTLQSVIDRINASAAGVKASYNSSTDRLEIVNNATGATAIDLTAGTSNFIDAMDLVTSGGTATGISAAATLLTDQATPLVNQGFALTNSVIMVTGWKGTAAFTVNAGDSVNNILANYTAQGVDAATGASLSFATGMFTLSQNPSKTPVISLTPVTGNFTSIANLDGAVYASGNLASTAPMMVQNLIDTADTLQTASFATPVAFSGGTAGRLSLTHEGVTRTFDYTGTTVIGDLLAAITADPDLKVDASYDPVADQIVLVGKAGTSALVGGGDVANGGSTGNLAAVIGLEPYSNAQTLGVDAEYKLDGLTYYSSSNTIADKIEGMTFTLAGATASAVTLSVSADSAQAKSTIKSFVDAYNAALEKANALAAEEGGAFYNDPTMRDIVSSLRRVANTFSQATPSAEYRSLAAIGITSGDIGMAFTDDYIGKLEIDESKLAAALADDPEGVRDLFFYDPNGGTNFRFGIGYAFENLLAPLTDATGTLFQTKNLITESIADLEQRIGDYEDQLAVKEQTYRAQFTSLEVAMGKLQRQSQWLAQQLGQVGSFSSGASSSGA